MQDSNQTSSHIKYFIPNDKIYPMVQRATLPIGALSRAPLFSPPMTGLSGFCFVYDFRWNETESQGAPFVFHDQLVFSGSHTALALS